MCNYLTCLNALTDHIKHPIGGTAVLISSLTDCLAKLPRADRRELRKAIIKLSLEEPNKVVANTILCQL